MDRCGQDVIVVTAIGAVRWASIDLAIDLAFSLRSELTAGANEYRTKKRARAQGDRTTPAKMRACATLDITDIIHRSDRDILCQHLSIEIRTRCIAETCQKYGLRSPRLSRSVSLRMFVLRYTCFGAKCGQPQNRNGGGKCAPHSARCHERPKVATLDYMLHH